MNETKEKGVKLPPNPSRLVHMMAAVGHTMPSAVADLVDNAISADATEIEITFGRPDEGRGRWMTIRDNGHGMDASTLAEAMRLGSDSEYEDNSLGKYGYGLKGASWSQSKFFTVVTKRPNQPAQHLSWDVDNMEDWVAINDELAPWENQATELEGQGTAVLWRNMLVPQTVASTRGLDPYSAEVRSLDRHLSLVFHRFLEGNAAGRKKISIKINDIPVLPNNPVGHPKTTAYDAKTVKVPTANGEGKVEVQAFLLPSEDEINSYHQSEGAEAVRNAQEKIGLHGKRNETQGLFIYRHDRLIKWGGWHEIWATNDEKTKLARVIVDFDKILDESFSINISKQIVRLPHLLQETIRPLAVLARKASQQKYKKPRQAQSNNSSGLLGAKPTSTTSDSGAPSEATSDETSPPLKEVGVKEVITNKFVWKLTKSITGSLDIQISEVNPSLAALVKQIRENPKAIEHLAGFLGKLDVFETQKKLMGE